MATSIESEIFVYKIGFTELLGSPIARSVTGFERVGMELDAFEIS